jgi:hypothetical protein
MWSGRKVYAARGEVELKENQSFAKADAKAGTIYRGGVQRPRVRAVLG